MMSEITQDIPTHHFIDFITDHILEHTKVDLYQFNKRQFVKVFLNGDWIGYVLKPKEFVIRILQKKSG